jgi:hypothetical protein
MPIAMRQDISTAVIAQRMAPPTKIATTPARVVRKKRAMSTSATTCVPVRESRYLRNNAVSGARIANATARYARSVRPSARQDLENARRASRRMSVRE